ncbi:hypothetical protein K474DRAFT_1668335 [Panus rudis PR-1116 ss-1]|nr:hypothetical protein K474DRAFT_1668335 [Panus rudis PR-1116 ss-1]
MEQHIRQSHQGYAAVPGVEDGVQVPIDMWRDMFITRNEEQKMGIPEEKIPYKVEPPSPSVAIYASTRTQATSSELLGANADSRGRKRTPREA